VVKSIYSRRLWRRNWQIPSFPHKSKDMRNPYRPDEDNVTLNLERFFLAGDFVSGVGYGKSFSSIALPVSIALSAIIDTSFFLRNSTPPLLLVC
jgi:hypothetical protein